MKIFDALDHAIRRQLTWTVWECAFSLRLPWLLPWGRLKIVSQLLVGLGVAILDHEIVQKIQVPD
jgi:hypothetical protein